MPGARRPSALRLNPCRRPIHARQCLLPILCTVQCAPHAHPPRRCRVTAASYRALVHVPSACYNCYIRQTAVICPSSLRPAPHCPMSAANHPAFGACGRGAPALTCSNSRRCPRALSHHPSVLTARSPRRPAPRGSCHTQHRASTLHRPRSDRRMSSSTIHALRRRPRPRQGGHWW